MPVRNNITGLWRHYKLSNIGNAISTGCDSNVGLTGNPAANTNKLLKDLYLIVDNADSTTTQKVEPVKALVGTPKTKIVNIGVATDTLTLTGPMFFVEDQGSAVDKEPKVLVKQMQEYGDASSVAASMLYTSTNFTVASTQTSYAKNIKLAIDESGAKFTIAMEGDPTSLFANFSDPNNVTAPFGFGSGYAGSPSTPLNKALRVATFYDFFVSATVNVANGTGSPPSFSAYQIGGAIRGMEMTIQIGADPISLLGMGQAPYFAINQVQLDGTMRVVFPLLSAPGSTAFPTMIPTWQALPNAWGTSPGLRSMVGGSPSPSPLWKFPDTPDRFVVDTMTVIPKYVSNEFPLFSSDAFGSDLDLQNGIKIVMKDSNVNISTGVLEAKINFTAIFSSSV